MDDVITLAAMVVHSRLTITSLYVALTAPTTSVWSALWSQWDLWPGHNWICWHHGRN